jgi:ribonuclease D
MRLITDQQEFAEVIRALDGVDRYALDTEFHRERTYFPQVALVQIAWYESEASEPTVVLVDPLVVDLAPFAHILDSTSVCVLHAGVQDLEVLDIACGTIPAVVFDTQIAAGFLGISSGSLASLLDKYLDIRLAKGDRLTDWLRRPLTDAQLTYAAGDVDHLLQLTDLLVAELEVLGRLAWAHQESEIMRTKPRNRRAPEDAVARIKEARSLKAKAGRVATSVAAWRERKAAELDIPVRQVLPDLAVVTIAQKAPVDRKQLLDLRGVDGRHLRNGADGEILRAVTEGVQAADAPPMVRRPELPRELRPVVTLVTAWISQLARDHRLDPALLATRADVEALLSKQDGCRLLDGWRADLVGEPIRQLVGGDAAVAFDSDGHLVLEARSHQPLLTRTA